MRRMPFVIFFSNAEIKKPDSLKVVFYLVFFEKTCEDHAPTITIDPIGSLIYVSRTNIPTLVGGGLY